jgi:PAS domain S-box-containing protein
MSADTSIIQNMTLEQALGTMPSGVFVVNREMQIVYWNPAAARITGFSAAEAVGQHCSFLQGVPCGEHCGLFNRNIPKPIVGAHCNVVTKTGETIHLLKNMDYLRDDAGEIIGGIESFIDLTRQHSLEGSLREQAATLEMHVEERTRELKKSEARFRTVLENMDDMAYIAAEDFRLTFMNRAMVEVFGDRVGDRCFDVMHNASVPCSWCPMDKVFRNRTVRDERNLGDRGRIYEIVHSPLPEEDGLRQKLAVCRDITERKKAEQELQEANRELDAFAHSISHDLRGILAPVVTYMDFLRLTYAEVLDDQVLQILGEVERQSERAIALLDDLLDLAQVSHVKTVDQATDVNMIIEEVLQELRVEHADHQVTKEVLPPIWLPESLVYQIFSNLVGNAFNYAPAESGPIEIGSWKDANTVTYFVRDHGPGVPNKESKTVFDIFYRGKASQGHRGTGVGLAIVRKIALRCMGDTWVEQTPGGGATFCISLPKQPTLEKDDVAKKD